MDDMAQSRGPDRRAAYRALCAVLHALCDRLTVDEAAYFDDQPPMLVRGLYFDELHRRASRTGVVPMTSVCSGSKIACIYKASNHQAKADCS